MPVISVPYEPRCSAVRSPKKQRKTCQALCTTGYIECGAPVNGGGLWCPRHNEERVKVYTNYKAHHALLDAYPDTLDCHDFTTITSCGSLPQLREWNSHLRRKYNLLTRCIDARVYFSERFYGNDMDFGHKTFWEGLVKKRAEVENLLFRTEARAHQLILQEQNALWVLERNQDNYNSHSCSGYDDNTALPGGTLQNARAEGDNSIEDPLEVIIRNKAVEFREKIRIRLASYCISTTSKFYDERLEVIYSYICRLICQEPTLMFLSQSYSSVMTVLNDDDLDLGIVEKIWNAIKSVCPRSLQLAVDDVVRTTQDEEHIVVLGRKVFKAPSGERWPLHAWGHMVAIHRCYSCLRATCKTVDAIIDLTRYILLTGAQLTRSYLKCDYNFDSARELMLAGFIPSYLPMTEPRYFTATHRDHPHSDPVWEETKRNLVLYGALSFNDPKARAFVNGCFRHPDLMVMVRQGATGRVIRSAPVVWISRKRCARTSSDLASIPWEKATDIVLCQEKVLEAAQPVGWNHKNITDCLQVVIIDRSEGDMGDFVHKLVQIWCQVYRVKDQVELQTALEEPYEVAGELEKHIRVAEVDTLRSYQNLWPTMLSGVSVKKLMDLAETHA